MCAPTRRGPRRPRRAWRLLRAPLWLACWPPKPSPQPPARHRLWRLPMHHSSTLYQGGGDARGHVRTFLMLTVMACSRSAERVRKQKADKGGHRQKLRRKACIQIVAAQNAAVREDCPVNKCRGWGLALSARACNLQPNSALSLSPLCHLFEVCAGGRRRVLMASSIAAKAD